LLFGANKLPEIAKSFGKAFKEFKKEVKDISNEINDTEKNDEKKL
ncbi:MAG: preprotein translocase subunit TatA, partial [Spirochaetes bacterium GWD1_27_9]